MILPRFYQLAFLLLAIGFAEGALGPRSDRLTAFLSLIALLPPVILLVPRGGGSWRPGRWASMGLCFLGLAVWFAAPAPARYFALAAALGWLAVAQGDSQSERSASARTLCLTALFYAVFAAVRDHLTLWPTLVAFSNSYSSFVTGRVGTVTPLGPTYSGVLLLAAFAAATAAFLCTHRGIGKGRIAGSLTLFVLAVPGALLLGTLAPGHYHGMEPRVALGWRALQFLLLLFPLALLTLGGRPAVSASPRGGNAGRLSSMAAGLALAGLLLLTWSAPVSPRSSRVLLDSRGSFDMEPLTWEKLGPEAAGGASLATLPTTLEAMGHAFAIIDTIDASILDSADVLVVMNPTQEYSPDEHRAIWDFVSRGGGLLVLGDHTDIMGTMGPLNALLSPCGIAVNFDSAIPLVERWTWYGCIRRLPHPLLRGIRDESDAKVSVGASLSVSGGAIPLLIGRNAFSDPGDLLNADGAFLGNMQPDPWEPKGDLFLAAEASHGRGKVLVFGDTSVFQRSNLTFTYELVGRTITYLGTPGTRVSPIPLRLAGVVLLAAGAALLTLLRLSPVLVTAVLSTVAALWMIGLQNVAVVRIPDDVPRGRVAWIDLAHGNRVDIHSGRNDGIGSLRDQFWRHGFVALAAKEFPGDRLPAAEVFATVAPAIPFGSQEREALRRFVEEGGLLIVASGFEERAGAGSLLAGFGYRIGPVPIGAAHEAAALLEGHYVVMHESWPVQPPEGRGEVWAECWGYPLVVFETIGRGGLIVIGDSKFLCDVRQESSETYVESNIRFLRAAIEKARERMGQGS